MGHLSGREILCGADNLNDQWLNVTVLEDLLQRL